MENSPLFYLRPNSSRLERIMRKQPSRILRSPRRKIARIILRLMMERLTMEKMWSKSTRLNKRKSPVKRKRRMKRLILVKMSKRRIRVRVMITPVVKI